MAERQYLTAKFRIADTKTYTYHNDGEPVAEGDQVKVDDSRSDGWKRVFVVAVGVPKPTAFETKPILGKVEPEPTTAPEPDPFREYVEDVRSGVAGPNMFGDC